MISVVIPLYNKAPFIADTIQSVLDQRFTDFELLVVNDGSTDGSADILAAIQDERLQLIHIEHSGVSVARNTGINASKHDWIAFLIFKSVPAEGWNSRFSKLLPGDQQVPATHQFVECNHPEVSF